MGKFIMLGMSEEHARFMYELVKKEIESLDIVLEKAKGCDGLDWLLERRKTADDCKSMLTYVFHC